MMMAEWMTDEEMRRAEVDAQNARTAEAGYECAVRVEGVAHHYEMRYEPGPSAVWAGSPSPLRATVHAASGSVEIEYMDSVPYYIVDAFVRSVERQTVRDATPRSSPAMPITLGEGTPVAVDFGSRMFADDAKLDAAIRSAEAARPDTLPPQRYAIEDWASASPSRRSTRR